MKLQLYSIKEISEGTGIPVRTIREWEYSGRIKAVRLGRRVMIPAETLEKMITEGVAA